MIFFNDLVFSIVVEYSILYINFHWYMEIDMDLSVELSILPH